ncbi:hypothetical protein I2486_10455 [Cellulophaga sp. E16_2]|uniref:hypothetical protein n=1 Tax=Cellulophaga sp. E16_2 TaxID=2789297 RepID=UPI001A92BEA4|nr:hypothetical protein [Cellulophaga sp. E16_2]MBO0591827.1 hypothetical protein [Cellulophaga sp. E16_2]
MQIQIVILYFTKNNVLHMGDTYFAMHYPYIDLKSGASVNGYMEAHKRALLLIDEHTKFIPGHGTSSNKKELETNVLMLENTQKQCFKGY